MKISHREEAEVEEQLIRVLGKDIISGRIVPI